ncbi:MAG TPA: AMP-binding protein, partial [Blastocatellia bacterium]
MINTADLQDLSNQNGGPPLAGPVDMRGRMTNEFRRFERYETESSVAARFNSIAAQYRDRLAIRVDNRSYSYGELDAMSNCIAAAILQARGSVNEGVALFLSDPAWMIAAMFGVLKAGGFYIPIDPGQYSARDQHILKDSCARFILTSREHLGSARALSGAARIISIDEIDQTAVQNLPLINVSPDALAFVIYTSGSTGEPKGVMQTQRNVLAIAMKNTNALRINCHDRMTLLPAFTVGASGSDVFGSLLNGAALFPLRVSQEGTAALKDLLITEAITICHSVPAVFRHLGACLTEKLQVPNLRIIKLAGEAVLPGDLEIYRRLFPDSSLLHVGYGATEINIICQLFLDKGSIIQGPVVPVGYPGDAVRVTIVDDGLDPVAANRPGRIILGSRHLSTGYWGKPSLTASTFIPDPNVAGQTAYNTGDIGRLTLDGCLFHLGRGDRLVKVRGSGVDINELERYLAAIPGVGQAAAVLLPGPDGTGMLTALVTADPGASLTEPTRICAAPPTPDSVKSGIASIMALSTFTDACVEYQTPYRSLC